jgi:ribosome-binding ATPase YchF (GTP1/OBG family)
VLYVCNVSEADAATGNAHTEAVAKMAAEQGAESIVISAAIESEVAQLPEEESEEFLAALGARRSRPRPADPCRLHLLDLITYFTVGPKETRAWTIERGTKAPGAAGVIHTDFERGFIRAFTIAYDDYVNLGGEVPAKEAGKARDEGKEYVVQDGDVIHFRFNT